MSPAPTFNGVVSFNNKDGFWYNQAATSERSTLNNLAVLNNADSGSGTGIRLGNGTTHVKFTGTFVAGSNTQDCVVGTGVNPGITGGTCALIGNSTATLVKGPSAADTFVGYALSDITNQWDDDFGKSTFSTDLDFFGFDKFLRLWGKAWAGLFSDTANRGSFLSGNTQLFDYTLKSTDNVLLWRTSQAASADGSCPEAVDGSIVSVNQNLEPITFLTNASEFLGDMNGNDNGLCESNERCLINTNIGAYQGHGPLQQCRFADGIITGVSMFGYTQNGY